jgi:hypothetical protein
MPQYSETLSVRSAGPANGAISYARIPNAPATQPQPQAQPQQQPVPLVAASPQPGPAPVPVSPGTAIDWGVLGTAVAAIAWFMSQVGQDVPAG